MERDEKTSGCSGLFGFLVKSVKYWGVCSLFQITNSEYLRILYLLSTVRIDRDMLKLILSVSRKLFTVPLLFGGCLVISFRGIGVLRASCAFRTDERFSLFVE